MFYDYVDSGSWTESTYRANELDLATICFRQRVAVNIENRSIRSTMIGEDVVMPVALAPTGLCGMQHADGEILAARAAEAFDHVFPKAFEPGLTESDGVFGRSACPSWG
jgi:L-lactate dehydrogenase (cytochrome)